MYNSGQKTNVYRMYKYSLVAPNWILAELRYEVNNQEFMFVLAASFSTTFQMTSTCKVQSTHAEYFRGSNRLLPRQATKVQNG